MTIARAAKPSARKVGAWVAGSPVDGELKLGVHRQAEGVVGDDDHRPVFAKRPQPGQHHSGPIPGQGDLQIDQPEPRQRSVAEGGGQTVKGGIDGLECRSGRHDDERSRDEGLGDDDASQRIGEVPVEMPPEEAVGTDQVDEQDAAHDGRQGQRQLHRHQGNGAKPAPGPGQHVSEGTPKRC